MRKRILLIFLSLVTGLFLMTTLSVAQQTTPQEPAKPKSSNIQRQSQPVQVGPRVYTIRELEKIRLKNLKNTDLIDMGAKRLLVQEVMDMIARRELKVGDPNDPAEVARALRHLYPDSMQSGVTLYK